MIRKIIIIFITLCLLSPNCVADDECKENDCGAWTQDMFTELVTFVYNVGEQTSSNYGVELYNISLELPKENDIIIRGHLGLYDFESYVVLIVESITHNKEGDTVIDHNFYTSYFVPYLGEYYYLPHLITGNIIVKGEGSIVKEMVPKISQEFALEGYNNEEWLYWMGLFYEYMLTEKSKGRSI